MTTQETAGYVFFLLFGTVSLVFRNLFTNYLVAMYTSWGMRPERELVHWLVVVGGVIALMFGGLGLLGIR